MSIDSLSDKAKKFYVSQSEIDATHPMNDGVESFSEDEAAMILVGERHGKRELVDLVRTLLMRVSRTEQDARIDELTAERDRYKAAIRSIDVCFCVSDVMPYDIEKARDIARNALRGVV